MQARRIGKIPFERISAADGNYYLDYCHDKAVIWLTLIGLRSVQKGLEALRALEALAREMPHRVLVFDYRCAEYPEDLFAALQMYAQMTSFLTPCTVITLREDPREPITPLLTIELRAAGFKVIPMGEEAMVLDWLAHLDAGL